MIKVDWNNKRQHPATIFAALKNNAPVFTSTRMSVGMLLTLNAVPRNPCNQTSHAQIPRFQTFHETGDLELVVAVVVECHPRHLTEVPIREHHTKRFI